MDELGIRGSSAHASRLRGGGADGARMLVPPGGAGAAFCLGVLEDTAPFRGDAATGALELEMSPARRKRHEES